MYLPNSKESTLSIAEALGDVRRKGVRLWSENGQLHYKAPKGALTPEEIERLRVSRRQIVALLETSANAVTAGPRLESRSQNERIPLSFSQLTHWNLSQLRERPSIRQITSATRLGGRLNVDALRKSIAEVVRRQDALRTRIVTLDGTPAQEITTSDDFEFKVDDLTPTPEGLREAEVMRLIEQYMLEPINVALGPLFGVRLLKIHDDEHVLIVAMEHMISDMFSMTILLRDVFTAYIQVSKGRECSLPAIRVQFADYSVWQRESQKSWIAMHGAYWNDRLAGRQRLRFPEDKGLQTGIRSGTGTMPLLIGRALKAELSEWCRIRRTTAAMSVFTAYVALVLRWCSASEIIIQYVTDGRGSQGIEHTIGYFASMLYLRIELSADDNFVDLLNRVTDEYCEAYRRADCSYMAGQVPSPDFVRNTAFNWIPQGSGMDRSALVGLEDTITHSRIRLTVPALECLDTDIDPAVLLYDTDDEIIGSVYFQLNRFSHDTMERFGRNFLLFIKILLRQPEECVKNVSLL